MGRRFEIDWDLPLRFNIGKWQIGTHPSWAPSYPDYYGLHSGITGHSQATSFSITAYWQYLEFDYVVQGETGYDVLQLYDATSSTYLINKASSYLSPNTFSKTFDGSLRTLTFTYRKDGSNSVGFDSSMILRMVVETANDELVQFTPYFAFKDNDTGNLYKVQDNSLVQIDIDLESANYDAITSTFMELTDDAVEEVLALNTFENASFVSVDMPGYDTVWCEYYTIKPNSIIMDNTARDYTAHEYVEAIDTINISAIMQEGDNIGVAIGIDDDLWVLNNVDSEGNVITYTTEELTPELIISLGFSTRNPVPDEIKAQLLIHRKLKFAYVMDINNINSETTLLDVSGTFITTLAVSDE